MITEINNRLDQSIKAWSGSITTDNSKFTEGVIYGLNLAVCIVNNPNLEDYIKERDKDD